jgi:hypothetical protein
MEKVSRFAGMTLAWAGVAVVTGVCWVLIQQIMKTM